MEWSGVEWSLPSEWWLGTYLVEKKKKRKMRRTVRIEEIQFDSFWAYRVWRGEDREEGLREEGEQRRIVLPPDE
jgi:hypothetical protein